MIFQSYREQLSDSDRTLLSAFFEDFNSRCLLSKLDKNTMREDFEKAILFYAEEGLSLQEALKRLDLRHLGGFYARPPITWFPLDDAAKIYPLSMAHGNMSVFRLSLYLKEAVEPILLQMALNFTIKRFPSFATTVKKGFFWHYLDSTKRRFIIERERDLPCQPMKVSHSGSTSFRVLYFENRISVEFFHMLADGTGGMTFLKVLTAEYLRLRGITIAPNETLWDSDADPTAEEVENAFTKVPVRHGGSGFMERPAMQMSGKPNRHNPCRVIHFKMPVEELKNAATRCHATVTAYLLALSFLAFRSSTDELKGECSIQVPVNMRKFYPSNTVRNFSMYCAVRIPLESITDFNSLIARIKDGLREGTAQEPLTQMVGATERLVNTLKYIPLFIKQPVARMVTNFLNDNTCSNIFSNLGVVRVPSAMAAHIESADFTLSTYATKRCACTLVSINDTATLTITKNVVDPSFEERLYDLLLADGLSVHAEGSALYED